MIMCAEIDGPLFGYCTCGWPLLSDYTCSNGECFEGWHGPTGDDAREESE